MSSKLLSWYMQKNTRFLHVYLDITRSYMKEYMALVNEIFSTQVSLIIYNFLLQGAFSFCARPMELFRVPLRQTTCRVGLHLQLTEWLCPQTFRANTHAIRNAHIGWSAARSSPCVSSSARSSSMATHRMLLVFLVNLSKATLIINELTTVVQYIHMQMWIRIWERLCRTPRILPGGFYEYWRQNYSSFISERLVLKCLPIYSQRLTRLSSDFD